jgi:hypothetical protein
MKEQIRENWEEMFVKADSKNDYSLLISDVFQDESFNKWTW